MIYLLDTNVLSEVMKPQPAQGIATWIRAVEGEAEYQAHRFRCSAGRQQFMTKSVPRRKARLGDEQKEL